MKGALIVLFAMAIIGSAWAQPPLSKRDQKKKAAFEAQIVAEEKYEKTIAKADEAFKKKNYVDARMLYAEAIQYNPGNEQWLTSKVNDLDILMAKNIAREVDSVMVMVAKATAYELKVQGDTPIKLESRILAEGPLPLPQDSSKAPEPEQKKQAPAMDLPAKNTQPKEPDKKPEHNVSEPAVELKVKEDFSNLPLGRTEETFDFPDHQVLRIVIKDGIDVIVYKRVTHRWGGKFYFKDDVSMSERIWLEEVAVFRQKYPSGPATE